MTSSCILREPCWCVLYCGEWLLRGMHGHCDMTLSINQTSRVWINYNIRHSDTDWQIHQIVWLVPCWQRAPNKWDTDYRPCEHQSAWKQAVPRHPWIIQWNSSLNSSDACIYNKIYTGFATLCLGVVTSWVYSGSMPPWSVYWYS